MAQIKLKKFLTVSYLLLFVILLIGAYFRLYKISGYMNFLGDEGRDVIVVRRFLLEAHPPLIGPGTSIGNMYLGPLYYYLIAPALFLANYNPVGPAIEIALIGVLTIWLVWKVCREWFGTKGALVAAFLYAISPTIIIYSKSSWNPNIMPFFSLLCIYSIWKVWHDLKFKWLIVLGISYAFVLQSHYLGLLLLPTFIIFWFLALLKIKNLKLNKNYKFRIKNFLKYTVYAGVLFLLLMSPLAIFDSRHNWQNFNAMKKFFTERQATVSIKPWNSIPNLYPQLEKISARVVSGRDTSAGKWVAAALVTSLILVSRKRPAYLLLITWAGFGLMGLALYKQEIYDHYYGFLFTAPFIIFAGFSEYLLKKGKIRASILILASVVVLAFYDLKESPLKYPPNMQLQRSMDVAKKIAIEANGMPLNLAVLAERNYDGAYRYFLNIYSGKVLDIDPQKYKETVASQLFVVCEMEKKKCNPIYSGKTEIANFGWSKVDGEWDIDGVTLYKLGHNTPK